MTANGACGIYLRAPLFSRFQYPRADLLPCNSMPLRENNARFAAFQYASCGSTPLPRCWPSRAPLDGRSLSVSSCGSTPLPRLYARQSNKEQLVLSVSSCGSTPLSHPLDGARCWPAPVTFSILERIDSPATRRVLAGFSVDWCLSVSSSGSTPLPPSGLSQDAGTCVTFSILVRIDSPATVRIRIAPPDN